jgi:DNA topoisomerase-3
MGKSLIITEKPSVARDITNALGGFEEKDGGEYWESEQFVCTFAVGHLLGLIEPEDIDVAYKRWSLNNLPIIPAEFKLKPKPGQTKRLACIKKLAGRADVDGLINACDAAREGELIFREILDFLETKKSSQRLWLRSMTQDAIKVGFKDLRASETVHGLGEAAECRSKADWLIGMNATRALSVRLRTKSQKGAWSAGRVQTPTLSLLVDRELEILDFVPEAYWRITAKFKVNEFEYEGYWYDAEFKKNEEHPELRADRIFGKDRADQIIAAIAGKPGLASESRKARESKAPGLFNLTALQKAMSSRYGWSAKRTLQAAQRCYESHKVLTYPRTSSYNLPNDYVKEVDRILEIYATTNIYGTHAEFLVKNGRENDKKIFDDAGVTDHFAIIPTGQFSAEMQGDDQKLFDTVARRFLAAFFPSAFYDKVDRYTVIADQHFRTGPVETLVTPGWLSVYEKLAEDKQNQELLEPLVKGQIQSTDVKVLYGDSEIHDEQTKPPARIGEARLLSLMEHAGRHVEDEELASALMSAQGLGTAATRADIIENLKAKEYVDQTLRPTPKGIRLIDTLRRMDASRLTSVELTAELEIHLNEVEDGKRTQADFIKEIGDYVGEVVNKVKDFDYDLMFPDQNPLGKCPICKTKNVYERAWFFACETNTRDNHEHGCGLLLWKDSYGRYLNRRTATYLIEHGETAELDGFRNASGQSYKGIMVLEGSKVVIRPTGAIEETADALFDVNPEPLGFCPLDEGNPKCQIIETPSAFVSEVRRDALLAGQTRPQGFILPRLICKREMTREEAIEYMKNRETPVFGDFISKKGRKFRAKLKMKPDGRHEFEFPPREARKRAGESDEDGSEATIGADGSTDTSVTPKAKKPTAPRKVVVAGDSAVTAGTAKVKKPAAARKATTKKAKIVADVDSDDVPF